MKTVVELLPVMLSNKGGDERGTQGECWGAGHQVLLDVSLWKCIALDTSAC